MYIYIDLRTLITIHHVRDHSIDDAMIDDWVHSNQPTSRVDVIVAYIDNFRKIGVEIIAFM